MENSFDITVYSVDITVQIASVAREIAMRKKVYPRFVADGKMTQDKADAEIATMQAVLATLQGIKDVQRPGLF